MSSFLPDWKNSILLQSSIFQCSVNGIDVDYSLNFCSFLSWLPSAVCFAVILWIQKSKNTEDIVHLSVYAEIYTMHTVISTFNFGLLSLTFVHFDMITKCACLLYCFFLGPKILNYWRISSSLRHESDNLHWCTLRFQHLDVDYSPYLLFISVIITKYSCFCYCFSLDPKIWIYWRIRSSLSTWIKQYTMMNAAISKFRCGLLSLTSVHFWHD